MYVCLCNAITDAAVRAIAGRGAQRPSEVYRECGCKAQCANCAATLLTILREERGGRAPASA